METNGLNNSVQEEQFNTERIEDTSVTTLEETRMQESSVEEESNAEPSIDFSDEEVSLAASASEYDLGEENEDIDSPSDNIAENIAFTEQLSGKNKAELVALFAEMLETQPVQNLRKNAEAIKVAFYKMHRAEIEANRKAFIEAGGNPEEFKSEPDGEEHKLKELFGIYRTKRNAFLKKIEDEKEKNYAEKLKIIEELKELVNSNETMNQTFNTFRELQTRWKESGAVPKSHIKDLWETYHLHVENFYNFIKINKELRDLDLKKNYEAKLALCEEAEALLLEPSVINAFHKLQKLHEQWREIGPVANEYKEQLWDRFKEASSKINKKHQEHFDNIKEEQKRNLELKTQLCEKTEELADAKRTTRKEWAASSLELIEIQKVWKTIGFAPKKENTKIYERFRAACDKFFENKKEFYLAVKTEMENNLQAKIALCVQAEAIQDSEEWKKATNELIALQKQWKEIGAVPRKQSDLIWKRFRAACDHFFNRKSQYYAGLDSKYDENLQKKRELINEINEFKAENISQGFEALKEFQRRWTEIGFVPMKEKDALYAEYRKAIDSQFAVLHGNDKERKMERFKEKISSMKSGSDKKIKSERDRLYNKIKQLEADITLWENNIGFFAKSKNAQAMIDDVNSKIAKAKEEITTLIEKINIIDAEDQN